MLRALRGGGILGMLIDRDYTGRGIPVPFLGRQVHLPTGPAALSVQTGAPIIPLFLARTSPTRFTLIVDRPLRADPALDRGRQVFDLTHRLGGVATRHLACAPAQWVAFHGIA
jgi:KDO2-lipid IV(A) lauroyltransferase